MKAPVQGIKINKNQGNSTKKRVNHQWSMTDVTQDLHRCTQAHKKQGARALWGFSCYARKLSCLTEVVQFRIKRDGWIRGGLEGWGWWFKWSLGVKMVQQPTTNTHTYHHHNNLWSLERLTWRAKKETRKVTKGKEFKYIKTES